MFLAKVQSRFENLTLEEEFNAILRYVERGNQDRLRVLHELGRLEKTKCPSNLLYRFMNITQDRLLQILAGKKLKTFTKTKPFSSWSLTDADDKVGIKQNKLPLNQCRVLFKKNVPRSERILHIPSYFKTFIDDLALKISQEPDKKTKDQLRRLKKKAEEALHFYGHEQEVLSLNQAYSKDDIFWIESPLSSKKMKPDEYLKKYVSVEDVWEKAIKRAKNLEPSKTWVSIGDGWSIMLFLEKSPFIRKWLYLRSPNGTQEMTYDLDNLDKYDPKKIFRV